MNNMVVGFMFDERFKQVALIRKEGRRLSWQKGLLNGIGGGIELLETAPDAMIREFKEETGMTTHCDDWHLFALLLGRPTDTEYYDPEYAELPVLKWSVDCFWAVGRLVELKTMESEEVVILNITDLQNDVYFPTVPNLQWLIPMAMDNATNNRTGPNAIITYKTSENT